MKHSAKACITIPAIIINGDIAHSAYHVISKQVTACHQQSRKGIRNIPIFMEVIADRFAIKRVTKLTQQTTTNGFTLAIQPGCSFARHTDYIFRHRSV